MELLFYVIFPVLVTYLFRYVHLTDKRFTYLVTGVLVFCYPLLLSAFERHFNPASSEVKCGNTAGFFFIGNTLFFLPVTLVYQAVLNRILLKNAGRRNNNTHQ